MAESQLSSAPHVSAWGDVVVVVAITIASAMLAAHFEFNEVLFAHTRAWEPLQLDEWPVALFVLAMGLVWLSWRRNRQTVVQLRARQAAEARLAGVLEENRTLAHQHLRIQESERKHLARELHDELGQYLNAIKLDAVAVRDGELTDAAVSQRASERIIGAVDHVHGVVSDMIRRLRPAGLDELGLVAALENCVDHWRYRLPGTRFSLDVRGDFEGLGELLNLGLYRLIQEGLTNSYKHAGATRIDVTLRRGGSEPSDGALHEGGADTAPRDNVRALSANELLLTVSDDGRGADSAARRAGFGLIGMRERVEMMGGEFSVDSASGRGFRFEARLPAVGRE